MFGVFRKIDALNQNFNEHREEVKSYMEKTTHLMERMVALQANHTNLDKKVDELDKRLKEHETKVHRLDVGAGSLTKDVRDNKRVVWLIITLCITGIFGLVSKLK